MSTHPAHQQYEHMFRPAIREGVALIIGLAGASGTGKTMSALRLAQGIVGRDKSFAVIDTEAGRAKHYAPKPGDQPDFIQTFRFDHCDLMAPFRPDTYYKAIKAAAKIGYGAVVVDSFSHIWESEGGVLDWTEDILRESVGRAMEREQRKPDNRRRSEWSIREALKRSAWIEPKRAHKVAVQAMLQLRANIILCLRAEDKIDFVKDADGKTTVVPMQHAAGYQGWIPICDKRLPFELTTSFVLTPDKPGVPVPIKLQEQHRAIFPVDQQIGEESGRRLAEWARGGATSATGDTQLGKPAQTPSGSGAGGLGAPADRGAVHAPASPGPSTDRRTAVLAEIRGHIDSLKTNADKAAVCKSVFKVATWADVQALHLDSLEYALVPDAAGSPITHLEAACIKQRENAA